MTTSSRYHLSPSLAADRLRISQSYGLVRDDDTAGCQHILDHSEAERKPEIEPYGMGNHLRRKPVTTIERITCRSGHAARSHILIDARLTLQCRLAPGRLPCFRSLWATGYVIANRDAWQKAPRKVKASSGRSQTMLPKRSDDGSARED